jgi:hypothetical protein
MLMPTLKKDKGMIHSTTPSLQGREIKEYLGVVTGEAILGANIFKDFLPISGISLEVAQLPMNRNSRKPDISPFRK